jgi:hypothetical protein
MIAVLLAAGAAGGAQKPAGPPDTAIPPRIARDAYALYSSLYGGASALDPNELLLIAANAEPYPPYATKGCFDPQNSEDSVMADRLRRLGSTPHVWQARFDFGRPYKLLDEDQAQEAMSCIIAGAAADPRKCAPYRNARYVRYLSLPGFNDGHNRALIMTSRRCGHSCGNGALAVFHKSRKGWRPDDDDFARCRWVY